MSKMRRHAAPDPSFADEDVKLSSVLLGLAMVAALVVTAAAFMGGSLSRVESRFANAADSMARGVGLSVETVIVIGLDHDPGLAADVRAAAMVEPGENMFRADPHLVRTRVEAVRKVVNVRVHRLWPDQIVIMADPAEPLALMQSEAGWTVIDTLGRDMPLSAEDVGHGLVRVQGEGARRAALDLDSALANVPEIRHRIHVAERVAERRWDLHMAGGQIVHLPRDADMTLALSSLDALSLQAPVLDQPDMIVDLRLAGQIFITPPGGSMGGAA